MTSRPAARLRWGPACRRARATSEEESSVNILSLKRACNRVSRSKRKTAFSSGKPKRPQR
ncbi:hypothetical protein COCSUDRAFT_53290 [Coccomyxa subellipsoidea C-169]|uniref:Uncharacterized protein n=1 Tax=Coccomyxa subellipsoidea (strain C-169) TaxID=574566 RepID=I0Z0Z7_COCSC|nr:hypothetical protein COCSUDRAFT_53290 [Coccomyxa subellipsoidea C-169]EIE24316.1 hypothetical protein COCSUDRAFT_53290 [Coccomyxa subellipsoidea C-169]|eukprot:XP_005648860.1 hypothetical protein COCSUDRAFT_53290 [Coccomyxa subellipsoidea C-169]